MQAQGELFPRHFRRNHAHRQIGNLVLRVKPRPFRQFLSQPFLEVLRTVSLFRRNHEGFSKIKPLVEFLRQPKKHFGLHLINLVDRQGDLASFW